jgi:hypothetical protein
MTLFQATKNRGVVLYYCKQKNLKIRYIRSKNRLFRQRAETISFAVQATKLKLFMPKLRSTNKVVLKSGTETQAKREKYTCYYTRKSKQHFHLRWREASLQLYIL